jgi:DNA-3-methyladenine glycosylase II
VTCSPIPHSGVATMHEINVSAPYRLDLTVSALRRTSTNLVDIYTRDGRYLRAFGCVARPVIVSVTQPSNEKLRVSIDRVPGDALHAERTLSCVRRILGTGSDLSDFHRRARRIPWLSPLARRMRGLRPPRYPALFEACANAILFQQVSLQSASAIMRRLIIAIGTHVDHDGVPLVVFPSIEQFLGADDSVIRAAGLSAGKFATLRRAGEAIAAGELTETLLDELPSSDAARLLRGIKGIGPWTAAVILLRGLGRLDMFPGNDSGVAANLARVAGERMDVAPIAAALGSQRGMLYFCLLLSRLEAHSEIGSLGVGPALAARD